MDIYVFISYISIFSLYLFLSLRFYHIQPYIDFNYIAASNTATDDVTN